MLRILGHCFVKGKSTLGLTIHLRDQPYVLGMEPEGLAGRKVDGSLSEKVACRRWPYVNLLRVSEVN
jgi:hypothetical protein